MKLFSRLTAVLMLVAGSAQLAAETPIPVAERVVDHLGRSTRVTLFSNHVAVVTIRSESERFFRKATLSNQEYMVYLQALEEYAAEIGKNAVNSAIEAIESRSELTLHLGPNAPRTIIYSPLASLNLAAGKVDSIMADIQQRVLASQPGEDELKKWKPVVGESVELRHGGFAVVTAVAEDGTIILTQNETSVMITVGPEVRVEVIKASVEDRP